MDVLEGVVVEEDVDAIDVAVAGMGEEDAGDDDGAEVGLMGVEEADSTGGVEMDVEMEEEDEEEREDDWEATSVVVVDENCADARGAPLAWLTVEEGCRCMKENLRSGRFFFLPPNLSLIHI